MKKRFGQRLPGSMLLFILAMSVCIQLTAQTSMGILPVKIAAVGPNILNERQWQSVSLQLHDYLVMQLAGIGNVSKLTREHILLLLKEVPAPDPENLDAEAYRIISKKEKLHYLLKCTLETVQVSDKNVVAPVNVIIVDGNTGILFWENTIKSSQVISGTVIDEQILVDEVLKPRIEELSKEIIRLKY
jgi:hypothetical protein